MQHIIQINVSVDTTVLRYPFPNQLGQSDVFASDRTPNYSEPQINTDGFSTAIWFPLDVEKVDQHNAWQTAA